MLYTGDHGEAAGNHGLFAKSVLYDHAMTVPPIMAGPGIPHGSTVQQIVSHVDMPPQRFDLKEDTEESKDLARENGGILASLEVKLREIVDPEAADRRAKNDQGAHMERNDAADAIRQRDTFNYSPLPGEAAAMEPLG